MKTYKVEIAVNDNVQDHDLVEAESPQQAVFAVAGVRGFGGFTKVKSAAYQPSRDRLYEDTLGGPLHVVSEAPSGTIYEFSFRCVSSRTTL